MNIYVICRLNNVIMIPSELYYFICNCLVMDDDAVVRNQIEAEVVSGNVPWEAFVWMGSSHFVLPALYSAFRRNGIVPFLPGDLTEHLSAIYNINLSRNTRIIEQSHRLIMMLNREGIEPVFIKGAGYLLQNLFHDTGDRIMSDIDILIPAADIEKAAKVLYDNEYFHPEEFKNDDFEKHHHLPGFEHKKEVAMVELHHSVLPDKYYNLLKNDEIIPAKKKIGGVNAWVLSVNHQLVLNFVHDQLVDDDYKYKTMLIKGLYDFYLLIGLYQAGNARLAAKGYNSILNTYCAFISFAFNKPKGLTFDNTYSARIFKRQFEYLLNHPKIYGFYQLIVLYAIRIPIILETVITAPFSKQSRRYFRKKAGSLSAMRKYFKNLKDEI